MNIFISGITGKVGQLLTHKILKDDSFNLVGGSCSLNNDLSAFFASVQDLASNSRGIPERTALVAKAEQLTSTFNQTGKQLFTIQRNIDLGIDSEVSEINSITAKIGKLNQQIHAAEPPGQYKANDLRDNRDKLVKELSNKVDIQLMSESDGQISLTLKNGTALVLKDRVFELSTSANGNNKAFKDNNVTLIRADWTKPSTKINLFLEKYDRFGIPFNAFFSVNFPDGILLSELLSEKDILKTINKINNE